MLVLPFAVFVAWRLLAPAGDPPRALVLAVSGTAAIMAVVLLVLWYSEAEAPATRYVPAQLLENGQIVPPREERAPR